MEKKVEDIRIQFNAAVDGVDSAKAVNEVKVKFLGKKGPVQQLMKSLKDVAPEDRPLAGKCINDLKVEVTEKCERLLDGFALEEQTERLSTEKIDVTLPGRRRYFGRKHILTQVMDEVLQIMSGMGFSVQYGPDIETDYYNFEALNFPPDHPARDMQDTFYIGPEVLLRTHTSNIQVRVMETQQPPIRIAAPGRCFRNETITARSHVFFHQVEALHVDKGVTFADLFATADEFMNKLFYQGIKTRFRPSYFPFVEPGMELDIHCLNCKGDGCTLCKHTGWLEVAGAGMVHPEVLKSGGIDPEIYTGYAWGLGIERLVMLKHGIRDIRLFTENDTRFLEQFV